MKLMTKTRTRLHAKIDNATNLLELEEKIDE